MENNKNGFDKDNLLKISYWLALILLIFLQLIFTLNSTSQIRYEELAESIRNPYWLLHKTIYDGVSSNVGWYGILLIVYNFLGFSFNSAKFVRFFLAIISFFCLSLILKKYLGTKKALLPLLAICLSPTILYLTTLQTSYGIDLQYFPICFYLVIINYKNRYFEFLRKVFFGFISMLAWMSYPTFLFYLPSLFIFYFYRQYKHTKGNVYFFIKDSGITFFSFLLPLIIAFLYIKDKSLLFYDERMRSGIFRGAGSMLFNLNNFNLNINRLMSDLFNIGNSYLFELSKPDFTDFYPILTVATVIFICIYLLIKNQKLRPFIIFSLAIFLLNFLVGNFNFDPSGHPGIRRNTAILASFYIFFTIAWFYVNKIQWKNVWFRWFILIIFFLLPLHHFLVYFNNLYNLGKPSYYRELWFGLTSSPSKNLDLALNSLQKEDLKLSCKDRDGKLVLCRYPEIYAATAGACYWNRLNCKNILGFDPKTKKYIPLSTKLWEEYYWPH